MSVRRAPLPDSYEDILGRAQLAQRAGDTHAAAELYRRLVDKLGRVSDRVLARRPELRDFQLHAALELADVLREGGRYAEAIEVVGGLLTTHPEQAQVWRRDLALMRTRKGDVDVGISELSALAGEDPTDVWTWLALANETRIEGRYAESQEALDRALEATTHKDAPKLMAEVHLGRFRLYEATGQLDRALAAWEEALSADPEVGRTVGQVITLLTNAGRYSEAQRYIARNENELEAGFERGLLAELTGDAAQAKREWQAVAGLDPLAFEQGHDCWVEAVLRLGDPKPALQKLPKILAQHGSLRLLVLSAVAWAMYGDRERPQKLFEEAISLLRRGRPPKQKLDSADWRLLNALVADADVKTALRPYFAVVETIWG